MTEHADASRGGPTDRPETPATPDAALSVFGARVGLAEHFVALLADTGIRYGLIGPREAPRLWDRHVLNCAVVAELVPHAQPGQSGQSGQRLVDVGSGAGLPGVAIAIARPDLEVHLVEPLARRTAWLDSVVAELGLDNVVVHTARAEALWDSITAPFVTARAVAPILQLVQWTLPLLRPHGSVLALKGSRAHAEVEEFGEALEALGVVELGIEVAGAGVLAEPTTVLRATIGESVDRRRLRSQVPSSAGSARRRADRPRGSRHSGTGSRGGGRRAR